MPSDYDAAWDIDGTWEYTGVSSNPKWNDYYAGLWVRYTSQMTGHFKQCFFWWCDNLYPSVHLHAENSGYIYLDYANAG